VAARAVGAVVGSAVGDALGAPFEFQPAGRYRARFPKPVVGGIGEMVGGGGFGWAPGEFTDDTQMAVIQARSLLECGGIDGADLFARFGTWARNAVDVGSQTRTVLSNGHGWHEAAQAHFAAHPERAAGNGGVMRTIPAAVHFAAAGLDATVDAARRLAAVTHGDPAAGWGAAIVHAAVRAALHGADWSDAAQAVAATADSCSEAGTPGPWAALVDPSWTPAVAHPSNGSVFGCVAEALWAVRSTSNFSDAVVAAIDLGGDTDTVAAVAGGLAGAVYGIQAIPSRWTTYLHGHVDGVTVDGSDLQHLALALIGRRAGAMNSLHPPIDPVEVVAGVYATNLSGAARTPEQWAVVSLCRTGTMLVDHPVRRELYLIDSPGRNFDIAAVVTDALDTIDAFHAEGRTVVVHCHAGASRTGLILRAHLMRRYGIDTVDALEAVAAVWPPLSLWNDDFTAFLDTAELRGGV
jgi:ADP-ribosyl-[dinitrogen reductase] hydrolase